MALRMLYEELLTPPTKAFHEDISSYHHLQERHLQAMWYEQKYMRPLTTIQGKKIEVISPGLWNKGKGPDFCKAHLKIDGHEVFGDIEIHLDEDGWKSHHHHVDPCYNKVVLHLAYWGNKATYEIATESGLTIERVLLEKHMLLTPEELIETLDLKQYPYKEFLGSGRCAKDLFAKLKTEDIHAFFNSAADWRLQEKHESSLKNSISNEYRLAAGVAAVLGYRDNAQSFLELFRYLLNHRNLPEKQLLSLAMGVCGFFEKHHAERWEDSEAYTTLHSLWGELSPWALHQTNLQLNAIRPLNHPVRRLALLAKILHSSHLEIMDKRLLNIWQLYKEDGYLQSMRKEVLEDMLQFFPSYKDFYWNFHFTFENLERTEFMPLLGDDTRLQIVVNVFLPFLYENIRKRNHPKEMEAFNNFFLIIPPISTAKREYLSHRFFGEKAPEKIKWNAVMEQGTYQLHKDFCSRYESSCVGCPFVDRMQLLLGTRNNLDSSGFVGLSCSK